MNIDQVLLPKNIQFIFYHIEKCGGTSTRSMFNDFFLNIGIPQNQIFYPDCTCPCALQFYPENLYNGTIQKLNSIDYENIKVILCHFRIGHFPELDGNINSFKFTMIREPVLKLISHYNFFTFQHTKIEMIDLTDEEFSSYMDIYSNPISNILQLLNSTKTDLDYTKVDNFLNSFHFIGILETFDKDIEILNNMLNQRFNSKNKLQMSFQNKNDHRPKLLEQLIKRVKPYCLIDNKLYEIVKKHNHNKFQKFN